MTFTPALHYLPTTTTNTPSESFMNSFAQTVLFFSVFYHIHRWEIWRRHDDSFSVHDFYPCPYLSLWNFYEGLSYFYTPASSHDIMDIIISSDDGFLMRRLWMLNEREINHSNQSAPSILHWTEIIVWPNSKNISIQTFAQNVQRSYICIWPWDSYTSCYTL